MRREVRRARRGGETSAKKRGTEKAERRSRRGRDGGGDEVSYGAVGSRREGDTPCATRRVSTARAREKPGRRATSPAAGARSADPVDTARRQIRARASSDPSRRASRGFDRSRERHGRSADLTAPRRTYDGGAVVRHDRHGDRVSSRPVALRARVSNDAPPGLVLKTFQVTRKRFCGSDISVTVECGLEHAFDARFWRLRHSSPRGR